MTWGFFILAVLAITLTIYDWRKKREKIDATLMGTNTTELIDRFSYSPEEWKKFAEDDFRWVKNKDMPGEVIFSDSSILISNGQDKLFRDLDQEYTLTEIEFREKVSLFKIELREVRRNSALDRYEYAYEDLWIPIPPGNTERANRVVNRYYENMRTMIENQKGLQSSDLIFAQFLNAQDSENVEAPDEKNV